jgi:hypothetical protein
VCTLQGLEAQKTAQLKRVYYDFADQLKTNPSGNVPYTPIIPLLYGLRESLALLRSEGMENVIARHHRCVAAHTDGGAVVSQSTVWNAGVSVSSRNANGPAAPSPGILQGSRAARFSSCPVPAPARFSPCPLHCITAAMPRLP